MAMRKLWNACSMLMACAALLSACWRTEWPCRIDPGSENLPYEPTRSGLDGVPLHEREVVLAVGTCFDPINGVCGYGQDVVIARKVMMVEFDTVCFDPWKAFDRGVFLLAAGRLHDVDSISLGGYGQDVRGASLELQSLLYELTPDTITVSGTTLSNAVYLSKCVPARSRHAPKEYVFRLYRARLVYVDLGPFQMYTWNFGRRFSQCDEMVLARARGLGILELRDVAPYFVKEDACVTIGPDANETE